MTNSTLPLQLSLKLVPPAGEISSLMFTNLQVNWEYRKARKNPLVTLLSEFAKSPKEITRRLTNFTNFIFVRHPFRRLISAYTDKFVNREVADSRTAGILIRGTTCFHCDSLNYFINSQ